MVVLSLLNRLGGLKKKWRWQNLAVTNRSFGKFGFWIYKTFILRCNGTLGIPDSNGKEKET